MPRHYNRYNQHRMTLNTAGFEPVVFNPIEFKPVEADYNILERSFAKQEARQKEAAEKATAVDVALAKIEADLHNDPNTQAWWNDYKTDIKNQIDAAADVGDYAGALNTATRLAGKVSSDSAVLGRVRANQEYQAKVDETHKRMVAGQISPDTERWWLANNTFDYKDNFDENGNVIGGTSYSELDVPVQDIDISDLTQKAFKLITPNQTNNQITNANGTGSHYTRQWVTRKQIVDNLNDILDMTPGARESLYQRFQVEQHKYKELLEDENADPTRTVQQRNLLQKNGSTVDFNEFCVRMIEKSAISQNLAYDISTSAIDNQLTQKGNGNGSGLGDNTDETDVPEQSVHGEQFEQPGKTKQAQSNANASGKKAGGMRKNG